MAMYEKNHNAPSTPTNDNGDPSDIEKASDPQDTKQNALNEQQQDPNVVDWEGRDDPENPLYAPSRPLDKKPPLTICRNWSGRAKAFNLSFVILACLITPLASSMFAPAVPAVLRTFNTQNETVATFVVSIYILGFAVG